MVTRETHILKRLVHLFSLIERTTSTVHIYRIHKIHVDEPRLLKRLGTGVPQLEYQGGEEDAMHTASTATDTKYQNVKFSDQVGDHTLTVESNIDPTRKIQDMNDTSLEHFFRRPIKIYETEWGTQTTLWSVLDPWSLYFDNARVINRINNFKLLRCKLKLKVVINGNSFHYGRAYVAYLPLFTFDTMTKNRIGVDSDNINLSQLPKIFLDPTLSQGGEMELPFFWHENYLSIPEANWDNMGQVIIRSLTPLKHANGATDQVTISVFAWAEDVELSVLTSVDSSTLVPQGGDEVDHAQGRVSGPATAISKAAAELSRIPAIAPFAMATSIAAGATANIARALGYSRPQVDPVGDAFFNKPTGALALTNARDNSTKLTVDSKQELSIDPRIAGIGGADQMTIRSIASRESYLTQFTWAVGTAPEQLLWNARVDPCQFGEQGTPTEYHLTPACIAALPFVYWTGSMKFRFQIVASAFHRGRIKIAYDPDFLAGDEYNTNYTNIIDIAETRDFTIEVGNGQENVLLGHHIPGFDSVTQMYGPNRFLAKEEGNGVIGVFVVNELSVPNSSVNNDITINVFVSMGDDFEVFVPGGAHKNYTPGLEPQGGIEVQGGEEFPDALQTSEPSAPFQTQSEVLGVGEMQTDLLNKVYAGEAITSFRQMLKRYDYFRTIPHRSSVGLKEITYSQAMYPFYPGYVPGAVDRTAAEIAYNYCSMTLWHWTAMCFAGVRGGMRYKFVLDGFDSDNSMLTSMTSVKRLNGQVPYDRSATDRPTPVTLSEANYFASLNVERGETGLNLTFGNVNPANEVEIPFYSRFRFYPHRQLDWTTGTQPVGGFRTKINAIGSDRSQTNIYSATAEDFSLFFWICPPPLLFNTTLPTPSLA